MLAGMATVRELHAILDNLAPPSSATSWDRVGLQVGDPHALVTGVMVTLDVTLNCIEAAKTAGANLIVAHHPPIWDPISRLDLRSIQARVLAACLRDDIAVIGFHTQWDAASGGVTDALAHALGLIDLEDCGEARETIQWKLVTFVPAGHEESLIDALSNAGAGVIGNYRRCAFLIPGEGTFMPGDGAQPTIGQPGEKEKVQEVRIEMTVPEGRRIAVQQALTSAHPYETPAMDWIALRDQLGPSYGRVGTLPHAHSLAQLASACADQFDCRPSVFGSEDVAINRVGVAGGASTSLWPSFVAAGAQVLVTGEARHDEIVSATESGLALVLLGHHASEQPGMKALHERLQKLSPIPCHLYSPRNGMAGKAW